MESIKFYIDTYGCKVNQSESQGIREAWINSGCIETCSAEEADYIIINSCAITAKAERDARNAVYRWKRKSSHAKIILCGCAAQFFSDFKPRKKDFWASPDICLAQSQKILLLNGPDFISQNNDRLTPFFPDLDGFNRGRPIIKVQDGCSQNCTYCIVPQTRGKPVSRHPLQILAECKELLKKGFCELIISGVNLRQYKIGSYDFWDLIRYLDTQLIPEFNNRCRLRISSLEPSQLTEKGLETLANSQLLCPHLHLSLQHASPVLLKSMGRSLYVPETVISVLEHIRRFWPTLGLGADLLVGFPGETEEDIYILDQFIKKAKFTYAHVFPFSRRHGTKAGEMTGQLPRHIKFNRTKLIRDSIQILKKGFLDEILKKDKIIIASDNAIKENGFFHGVDEFYCSCIYKTDKNCQQLLEGKPKAVQGNNLLVEIL